MSIEDPRDQEHDMRHNDLLTAIHDLLDDRLPPASDWTVNLTDGIVQRPADPHGILADWERDLLAEDVTEEPPVGSQVTDEDGDVWHRFSDGWTMWDVTEWGAPGGHWAGIRYDYAPLRLTTDADRERVGLLDDADPTDALAKVIYEGLGDDDSPTRAWSDAHPGDRDWWRGVAGIARGHIEASGTEDPTYNVAFEGGRELTAEAIELADKAEAEVERLSQSISAAHYALTGGFPALTPEDWQRASSARDILHRALNPIEGADRA